MSQYALSLALPPIFTADTFFVSGCNAQAWQWIENWPNWQSLLLYGPAGSGKSHLGHIWARQAQAVIVNASELEKIEPTGGHWLIEDIEQLRKERPLLHLFNYVREHGGSMLMTSLHSAPTLPFTLPDLTSRLAALPAIEIGQPDDDVLAASIRKQFSDRQMKVDDEVIAYLLPRMPRSLLEAQELVELLDARALAEKKNITIPMVKRVLEGIA